MVISSPFASVYEQLGAEFAEYDGWTLPSSFGDANIEKKALNDACAAFDLSSFGRISLKGQGGDEVVKQVAGSTQMPDEGSWVWAESAGLRIGLNKGGYTFITKPGARQEVYDKVNSIGREKSLDNLKIADITEKTAMLGLYGPAAFDSMAAILPFDISDITPGRVKSFSFFMISVMILRGSWLKGEGLELICPASAAPMAAGAIVKYHKKQNITPGGMDCLLKAMKEIGL